MAHRDKEERCSRTLSYFDGACSRRGRRRRRCSRSALMDETCPPSTVYAAYNHYGGPEGDPVYPYNDHEGGEGFHDVAKLRWLAECMGRAP